MQIRFQGIGKYDAWAERMAKGIQQDMTRKGIISHEVVTVKPNEIFDKDVFLTQLANGIVQSIELDHDSLKVRIAKPLPGRELKQTGPKIIMSEVEKGKFPARFFNAMHQILSIISATE